MIKGKLNIAKLVHVKMEKKGKTGMVKGIFLPIENNHFFEGKDGNLYLDIVAFALKEPKDGQSHLVKQSLPKDVREKMSKEEQNAIPIIGSLDVDGTRAETSNNAAPETTFGDDDDLPF